MRRKHAQFKDPAEASGSGDTGAVEDASEAPEWHNGAAPFGGELAAALQRRCGSFHADWSVLAAGCGLCMRLLHAASNACDT